MFLKISQKVTLTQVFSYEICESFKNTYSKERMLTDASTSTMMLSEKVGVFFSRSFTSFKNVKGTLKALNFSGTYFRDWKKITFCEYLILRFGNCKTFHGYSISRFR